MAPSSVSFAAGPSPLPKQVLQKAQKELVLWPGSGGGEEGSFSLMEMSHRSKAFRQVMQKAEDDMRAMLKIPNGEGDAGYDILFLQGGASTQFATVVMNLLPAWWRTAQPTSPDEELAAAYYMVTGSWSKKAHAEAQRLAGTDRVHCLFDTTKGNNEDGIRMDPSAWSKAPHGKEKVAFVYYCDNETISGRQFPSVPNVRGFQGVHATPPPLVCDMSSSILTKSIDIQQFGIIYAGAQKNLGIAGVTIVIIRRDLLQSSQAMAQKTIVPLQPGRSPQLLPTMLDYQAMASAQSLYNTPPTFSIYMMGLCLAYYRQRYGDDLAKGLEEVAKEKAALLYNVIDASNGFYQPCVLHAEERSLTNVTFRCVPVGTDADPVKNSEASLAMEKSFLQQAEASGLMHLGGHRSVGGIRASLYNAVEIESVERLVEFMTSFMKSHGSCDQLA